MEKKRVINCEGNLPSKQHHLENALRERLYLGIVMVNVVAAIFTGHLPMGLMILKKCVIVLICIHSPSIFY